MPVQIQDFVSRVGKISRGGHLGDEPIDGKEASVIDLGAFVVHCGQNVRVLDEECAHEMQCTTPIRPLGGCLVGTMRGLVEEE